jgi:arabinogalactan endo-1,4-beta-galactosidase
MQIPKVSDNYRACHIIQILKRLGVAKGRILFYWDPNANDGVGQEVGFGYEH